MMKAVLAVLMAVLAMACGARTLVQGLSADGRLRLEVQKTAKFYNAKKAHEQWILKNYKAEHAKLKAQEKALRKQWRETHDPEVQQQYLKAMADAADLTRNCSAIKIKRSGQVTKSQAAKLK